MYYVGFYSFGTLAKESLEDFSVICAKHLGYVNSYASIIEKDNLVLVIGITKNSLSEIENSFIPLKKELYEYSGVSLDFLKVFNVDPDFDLDVDSVNEIRDLVKVIR